MFGADLPEIGDVAARLFSGRGGAPVAPSLLPQTVGTATITAGTVVVNGGIGGIGAATGAASPGAGGLPASTTASGAPIVPVTRTDLPPIPANDTGAERIRAGWTLFPSSGLQPPGLQQGPGGTASVGHPARPPAPADVSVDRVWEPAPGSRSIVSRATGYSPQAGGDRIEGGYASSIAGPDGRSVVRTLDDYRMGRSDYVTLAGDPRYYGRGYTMPEVAWTSGGRRWTMQDVPGVVHDTGSAFRGAPEGRFDIALGRDLSFAERNQSMRGVEFIAQSSTRASAAIEKLASSSTDASSQVSGLAQGLQSIAGTSSSSGAIADASMGGGPPPRGWRSGATTDRSSPSRRIADRRMRDGSCSPSHSPCRCRARAS